MIVDVVNPDDTERQGRRPKAPVILSRAHPVLLVKLFEQEVPEIADGLVRIEAVAREPGERSKVAVSSLEDGIDAVGTCVGVRGSRVQMVVQELNGERIDVIPWSPNARNFIAEALSPAEVSDVILGEDDDGEPLATVIVPDDQLSLAIGRRGQNARLASQLTDWRIDIVGEKEAGEEVRSRVNSELFKDDGTTAEVDAPVAVPIAETPVAELIGVGPVVADILTESGFPTIGHIAKADPKELAELPNLGIKTAEKMVESARAMIETYGEPETAPIEDAEINEDEDSDE